MLPDHQSRVVQPLMLSVLLVAGQVVPQHPVRAVWADEVESDTVFTPVAAPAAVWADEIGAEVRVQSKKKSRNHFLILSGPLSMFKSTNNFEDNALTSAKIELSETSQKIEQDHNSTPVIGKNPIDRKFDIAGKKSNLFCTSNV